MDSQIDTEEQLHMDAVLLHSFLQENVNLLFDLRLEVCGPKPLPSMNGLPKEERKHDISGDVP